MAHVVIGAHFGDCGKGQVVNNLADDGSLVIRFNGSSQASHTVILNGKRHVFRHFGAGTLKGADTYWAETCYAEPISFRIEQEILKKDHGIVPDFHIHESCPIITPYDIFINQNSDRDKSNGTCGIGFGRAARRHEETPYKLFVRDLESKWVLENKLNSIRRFYDLEEDQEMYERFLEACEHLMVYSSIVQDFDTFIGEWGEEDIIFEGSQGTLLDRECGIFPHVTRSYTTSKIPMKILSERGWDSNLILVTRPYITRHGNGPMPMESNIERILVQNPNIPETNVENEFQGALRYGPLDLNLLMYSIKCQGQMDTRSIYLTCMDQLKEGAEIPIIINSEVQFIKKEELEGVLEDNFSDETFDIEIILSETE